MKQETGASTLEGAFIKTIHMVEATGGAVMNGTAWGVEIHDLVKTFGSFVAVDHVSLQVKKGEIFGFLGPNRHENRHHPDAVAGLLPPTSGRPR